MYLQDSLCSHIAAILSEMTGSHVTTAWRVLRLRMEGGCLQVWIRLVNFRLLPTRGESPALEFGERLNTIQNSRTSRYVVSSTRVRWAGHAPRMKHIRTVENILAWKSSNIVVESSTFLRRVREVPISNLGSQTSYPDWSFSIFLISSRQCRKYLKSILDRFLPHPF
jgi:hypothetical protein